MTPSLYLSTLYSPSDFPRTSPTGVPPLFVTNVLRNLLHPPFRPSYSVGLSEDPFTTEGAPRPGVRDVSPLLDPGSTVSNRYPTNQIHSHPSRFVGLVPYPRSRPFTSFSHGGFDSKVWRNVSEWTTKDSGKENFFGL